MPISLTCSCGKSLRLKDELAGRKIRCPECTTIQTVPRAAAPEMEILDVLEEIPSEQVKAAPPRLPPPLPFGDKIKRGPPPLPFGDQIERRPSALEEDRKAAGRRQLRRQQKAAAKHHSTINTNTASIGGGIVMIVVAIVWFFAGLALNRLFFYPPIMLVLGIVAIVKGALGQE